MSGIGIDQNPAFIPLFLVGIWCLVSVILAHVGGWQELATVYRAGSSFEGKRIGSQSASMRGGTGYRNVLTVGLNTSGVRLAVFFPFRLAHPPLFIPWSEITAESKRQWLRDWVELRFARVGGVPLVISQALAERIAKEVGPVFPWTPPHIEGPAEPAHPERLR